MPLDAICVTALRQELEDAVVGARIDKIHQPGRDEIVLSLRTRSPEGHKNEKLLLSANPQQPRAHFSTVPRENPEVAPMFCMLLRKHLSGARILAVGQPPMERLLEFHLEALDELGFRVERRLILEMMGRQANLILVDQAGRIIDSLRRVERDLSTLKEGQELRQVMAGMFYHYPPSQNKINPSSQEKDSLLQAIQAGGQAQKGQVQQWLLSTYSGLSPLICRELAYRCGGSVEAKLEELTGPEQEALAQLLWTWAGQREGVQPTILARDGDYVEFSCYPMCQYEDLYQWLEFSSLSQVLDLFYKERERENRIKQKGQGLIRTVVNARDRAERKLAMQRGELLATEGRERLRELGDLLTSNLHLMKQGMEQIQVSDFYSPQEEDISISLNPLLSPQKNAAAYYKKYNKVKKANEMLGILLEKGEQELKYLQSVLENIKLAQGEQDLAELRQELEETGYLRKQKKQKGNGKKLSMKPLEFRSTAGLRISVGKNNLQNDLLTTKQAFKSDIWFHTQNIHGSHVILWTEGKEADLQSLQEAATLAAWFSQGREGGKVPVDYTPVKYVKKPNGARPGMVIYTTYDTAMVSPDEALVERLRVGKQR